MKKLTTWLIGVVGLIGTPAFAADMVVKAPPPRPAPVYSWTGWYVGAHIGYGWDREDPSIVICHCVVDPPVPFEAKDILGGLQAGFNYQFNSLVVGVEGDFAWTGIKGTTTWIEEGDPHTLSTDIKWLEPISKLPAAVDPL